MKQATAAARLSNLPTEQVPVQRLAGMAATYNPRKISDHDLDALRRSLRSFGAVQPILVNRRTKRVIGGHQRIRAAQLEHFATLPVTYVDLDDAKERQLNLALNRIHGQFDEEKLAAVLTELLEAGADLTLSGFDAAELERVVQHAVESLNLAPDPPVPALPPRPLTAPGDVITLGVHRLVCGSATVAADVDRAMDGEVADAMWTDPPYGVEYEGGTVEALRIRNDTARGLEQLLRDAFGEANRVLKPGAAVYVAHPAGALSVEFLIAFVQAGWQLRQTLIWVKDALVLGHADYHYRHEPILYGFKPGFGRRGRGARGWYGGNAETSVVEVPKPRSSSEHPTSKPVELVARHLRNSTRKGAVVYEPFGGSGSTLIACEMLGRRCLGLELEPAYCDVIVQRWEAFTSKKAKRPKRGRA